MKIISQYVEYRLNFNHNSRYLHKNQTNFTQNSSSETSDINHEEKNIYYYLFFFFSSGSLRPVQRCVLFYYFPPHSLYVVSGASFRGHSARVPCDVTSVAMWCHDRRRIKIRRRKCRRYIMLHDNIYRSTGGESIEGGLASPTVADARDRVGPPPPPTKPDHTIRIPNAPAPMPQKRGSRGGFPPLEMPAQKLIKFFVVLFCFFMFFNPPVRPSEYKSPSSSSSSFRLGYTSVNVQV